MLETPHVIVGAAIASKIPNPYIALPLALASHFVLERVPHWNPHLNTEFEKYGKVTRQSTAIVVADVILALSFGIFIASTKLPDTSHFLTILLACFFSVLPDVVEGPYFFLGLKSKAMKKWIKMQKAIQVDTGPFWGLFTQVATILAAFLWLLS